MKKIIIIILFILTSLLSCKKDNAIDIPSYIEIDEIILNNSTHNITDAWVYINDNLQGVYELPAKFPILEEGQHNLRIKAGIKENGISGTRIAYPFYSSYIIEQLFTAETTISISPEVNYISSADFFSEDFEGIGMTLEETSMSDTSIIEDYNDEYDSGSQG